MRIRLSFILGCLLLILARIPAQEAYHWEAARAFLAGRDLADGYYLMASQGQIRLAVGKGFANKAEEVPFTDHTLATIGSITKPFTGTAILLLVEDGLIDLQAPIARYFKDVPADKAGITIHQLLTHSAGFPGAIGDDYAKSSDEDFLRDAFQAPLHFTPGTAYEYSNVGYSLLGILLERITGMSYSDFLASRIFEPAGMATAGYWRPGVDYSHLAHGYRPDGSDWGTSHDKTWNGREPYWHLKGNGGLLMSPQDMYHWYLALRGHTILPAALLEQQIFPHVPEGGGTFYGYGYSVTSDGSRVEHNGGNGIFKADMRWFPGEDLFLFAFTNNARVRLFGLADDLLDVVRTGHAPEVVSWEPIPTDPSSDASGQLKTAEAFIGFLQQYDPAKVESFISAHCTPGLRERNELSRLQEMFDRLHQDIGHSPATGFFRSGSRLKAVVAGSRPGEQLVLFMTFSDRAIDRIGAELEMK